LDLYTNEKRVHWIGYSMLLSRELIHILNFIKKQEYIFVSTYLGSFYVYTSKNLLQFYPNIISLNLHARKRLQLYYVFSCKLYSSCQIFMSIGIK
jgi:hypothetical protein